MNVFISWSGDTSKKIAAALNTWIPLVLQNVKIFYSVDDISKGEYWTTKLKEEFKSNITGIICLTKTNKDNPWILFESGALSNGIGKGKVFPLLFDFEISELSNPLALFNASKFEKEDFKKLIFSINRDFDGAAIKEENVSKIFDKFWNDLEKEVLDILSSDQVITEKKPKKDNAELLKESLDIQKQIIQHLSKKEQLDLSSLTEKIEFEFNSIKQDIFSISKRNFNSFFEFKINNRPRTISCNLFRFRHLDVEWKAFVGYTSTRKFIELFCFNDMDDYFPIPKSIKEGIIELNYSENGDLRYDFTYMDKYGYKNTMGGLNRMIPISVLPYSKLINYLLENEVKTQQLIQILKSIEFEDDGINRKWLSANISILQKLTVKK